MDLRDDTWIHTRHNVPHPVDSVGYIHAVVVHLGGYMPWGRMTLSELLEELRSSRTITQTGWAVHSHKPGDVLVRFHEDQSTVGVLSVKDHTSPYNHCGAIQIRIDDRDYFMDRAEFDFDVEIFGKIAMRGCYLDPGSPEWDYDCVYRVEFAYSRLEYMEAPLIIKMKQSASKKQHKKCGNFYMDTTIDSSKTEGNKINEPIY